MSTTSEELLNAIKSYATGVLKGNTTDTLGAPVDIINEAVIRPIATALGMEKKVSKEPVGGSKSLRKMMGMNAEDSNIAETIGSLLSVGGAAKAIIVPAFLKNSIKEVRRAEKYLKAGADAAKVEKELGMFKLPDSIDDGVMRAVISDQEAKLIMSGTPGKASVNQVLDYINSDKGPDQLIRIPRGDLTTLDKVLDHPELFKAIPDLKDVRVGNSGNPMGLNSAFYNSDNNYIGLGPATRPENLIQTLLHEVQHVVQSKYNMNTGGNPNMFLTDPNSLETAQKALRTQENELFELRQKYKGTELEDIIKTRQGVNRDKRNELSGVKVGATNSYFRIAGEREATAVEGMRADPKKYPSTLSYYGQDVERLIVDPMNAKKVDADPVIQAIIRDAVKTAKPLPSK